MNFKIGDRVVAYARYATVKGKVVKIQDSVIGIEHQEEGQSQISFFHEKQCRRLKPKQKRLECWVSKSLMNPSPGINLVSFTSFDQSERFIITTRLPENPDGWIHFREVRK